MTAFSPGNQTDQRNQTIFMLLFDNGIRIGELINLRMEDFRMNEGFLKVLGKGNKERLVPVGNNAQKALQKYLMAIGGLLGCRKASLTRYYQSLMLFKAA